MSSLYLFPKDLTPQLDVRLNRGSIIEPATVSFNCYLGVFKFFLPRFDLRQEFFRLKSYSPKTSLGIAGAPIGMLGKLTVLFSKEADSSKQRGFYPVFWHVGQNSRNSRLYYESFYKPSCE